MPNSISDINDSLRAQFDHIGKVKDDLAGVADILGDVTKLGDVVTEDDVVGAAGKIVGKGLMPANAMAGILAGMPENGGGQALASWLAQHEQQIQQQQMQVEQIHEAVGHQMAVSAHHTIVETLTGGQSSPASDESMADNALGAMPTQGNA